MILLKQSPRRTVALFPREETRARALVVKRFHHPGPIGRLFDRLRAGQELSVLERLSRAGVRVAPPVETRSAGLGWELVTEWIEGARPLERLLEARESAPPIRLLARSAAELLASAHAAGLDHPDLHLGNVLCDPLGRAWLVDLRRARIRRNLPPTTLVRDLVVLAAAARERTRVATRARFLSTYLDALPAPIRADLPPARELAPAVEARARLHRREVVRRAAQRWLRLSSVCRPFQVDELSGYCAAGVDGERLRALWKGDEAAPAVRGRPWRQVVPCWLHAARAREHAIPSVQPLALFRAPAPLAVFELPAARTFGPELAARLADRGLRLAGAAAERLLECAGEQGFLGPILGARFANADG